MALLSAIGLVEGFFQFRFYGIFQVVLGSLIFPVIQEILTYDIMGVVACHIIFFAWSVSQFFMVYFQVLHDFLRAILLSFQFTLVAIRAHLASFSYHISINIGH